MRLDVVGMGPMCLPLRESEPCGQSSHLTELRPARRIFQSVCSSKAIRMKWLNSQQVGKEGGSNDWKYHNSSLSPLGHVNAPKGASPGIPGSSKLRGLHAVLSRVQRSPLKTKRSRLAIISSPPARIPGTKLAGVTCSERAGDDPGPASGSFPPSHGLVRGGVNRYTKRIMKGGKLWTTKKPER